jgi:hypothetical protein
MSLIVFMTLDTVERELDLDTMLISEARELKKLTGWDYLTWRGELAKQDPDALAFAWWISNARAGTPLEGRFVDVDFNMAALDLRVVNTDADEDSDDDEDDDAEGPTGSGAEPETSSI